MKKISKKRKSPQFMSLFCGCGGLDLGFLQAGFECVGAWDIDRIAVSVNALNNGIPATVEDLGSRDLDFSDFKGCDVLLAGAPCQGFSTAGKRQIDDPRNKLLLDAGRIAADVLPRVFLAENVAGVKSGDHAKYWEKLRQQLRVCGYETIDFFAIGTKHGVAQIRKRMFLVAWRTGKSKSFSVRAVNGGVVKDVLQLLESLPNHNKVYLKPGTESETIATRILPGQKLCNVRSGDKAIHTWDIPEVFGKTSDPEKKLLEFLLHARRRHRTRLLGDADPVPIGIINKEYGESARSVVSSLIEKGYVRRIGRCYDLTNTFNGKFRRLRWDEPAPTVDTRFGSPRYFLHPEENRGLTVREAARIQGFPDEFVFSGPESAQYKMIGNAVPPPMAYLVAEAVIGLL